MALSTESISVNEDKLNHLREDALCLALHGVGSRDRGWLGTENGLDHHMLGKGAAGEGSPQWTLCLVRVQSFTTSGVFEFSG